MQENTITLAVDDLNNGTTADQVYSRFKVLENRTEYHGANHLPNDRDMFTFYRSAPTKVGNFQGVQKSAVKFTRDHTVAGVDTATTLVAPTIIEISVSMPLGVSQADVLVDIQRAIALVDTDTVVLPLVIQGDI